MEDQDVPVGIPDEAHVADARVLDADHLGATTANLLDGGFDVGDAQADPLSFRTNFSPCSSGFQNESVTFGVSTSPSVYSDTGSPSASVPGHGPRDVPRRDRHEVDLLDLHYGVSRRQTVRTDGALERVAVRVEERREMADAGVDRPVRELDAFSLELLPGLVHVADPKRDGHLVAPRLELGAHDLGRDERERDVAELELDPPRPVFGFWGSPSVFP